MYTYNVKELIRVYDGDTITVLIDLGFGISKKEVIRLYGINTPEIRGSEREEGLKSKDRLVQILEDNPDFYIKTIKDKSGKYGRLLGLLMLPGTDISINKMLINEGYAKNYSGINVLD